MAEDSRKSVAEPVAAASEQQATVAEAAPQSRRSVLQVGAAGLAGLALGAFGHAEPASAAAGNPLVMGVSNSAGTKGTNLATKSSASALKVTQTGTGAAVEGAAAGGYAGNFESSAGHGLLGRTASKAKFGVYGVTGAAAFGGGTAVRADGRKNHGLVASTDTASAHAILASNTSTGMGLAAGGGIRALSGNGTDADIVAIGTFPAAGEFAGANGVIAVAKAGGNGLVAYSPDWIGMSGTSVSGTGVVGQSTTGQGVHAETADVSVPALWAGNTANGSAFLAGHGIRGLAGGAVDDDVTTVSQYPAGGEFAGAGGVIAVALSDGTGVYGQSSSGMGVHGVSATGWAVYGSGKAKISGTLEVTGHITKPAGSFKIDHPLDPAGKFLYHSFVESPDMKNVYDGVVALDANGEATVSLPDWFDAINRDCCYQLTAIGGGAPDLHVKTKVNGNAFSIGGGGAGQEVSWQVTGIRKDAWAEAHRIPVEEVKTGAEKGLYLYPAEHGQPVTKGIDHVLYSSGPQRKTP